MTDRQTVRDFASKTVGTSPELEIRLQMRYKSLRRITREANITLIKL